MSKPSRSDAADRNPKQDHVLGVRPGKGPDQYGGSFAGGQSGGGAYANPHGAVDGDEAAGDAAVPSGQTEQGYFGGGQAGPVSGSDEDHHSASRRDAPDDSGATYRDHPSQQGGKRRAAFDASLQRDVANTDLAGEALEPGDRVQGSDGSPVTGKP